MLFYKEVQLFAKIILNMNALLVYQTGNASNEYSFNNLLVCAMSIFIFNISRYKYQYRIFYQVSLTQLVLKINVTMQLIISQSILNSLFLKKVLCIYLCFILAQILNHTWFNCMTLPSNAFWP